MTKAAGYVPRDAWKEFIDRLATRFQVYAPCREGNSVAFEKFTPDKTVCLDEPAHCSPKSVVFPQSETLFNFAMKKNADEGGKTEIILNVDMDAPDTLLFCTRPCDARGFTLLDLVYLAKDPYYRERRQKTTVISYTCPHSYSGCFCTSVECGPADANDSDVLITELEKGYYIEAITEKGSAALAHADLEDGEPHRAEAHRRRTIAERQVDKVLKGGNDLKIEAETFQSDSFWDGVSEKCLSCGACTYLCPTCYCFNITDEQGVHAGERIRSWDSCMFPHYTVEASGHNPRGRKAQRLKNRIGHKFVYYRELYGKLLCSGCGRCIRHCPVSVNIGRIVSDLIQPPTGTGEGTNQ